MRVLKYLKNLFSGLLYSETIDYIINCSYSFILHIIFDILCQVIKYDKS